MRLTGSLLTPVSPQRIPTLGIAPLREKPTAQIEVSQTSNAGRNTVQGNQSRFSVLSGLGTFRATDASEDPTVQVGTVIMAPNSMITRDQDHLDLTLDHTLSDKSPKFETQKEEEKKQTSVLVLE